MCFSIFCCSLSKNITEASVLSNATSMMNQKLTIRMLQDLLRRLQLVPDPAASIQAGSRERCVQLAASLGLISVESAEYIHLGLPTRAPLRSPCAAVRSIPNDLTSRKPIANASRRRRSL